MTPGIKTEWAYYEHTGVHTGLRAPLTLTAKIIGTSHTSAKESLTSSAVRQISMNECPVTTLYISPNTDRHQNVITCSLAHCQPILKNFMQMRSDVFE